MCVLLRLVTAVSGLLASIVSPMAAEPTYPSRAVRMIVPFGAGGPADIYARILAQHLSEALKQSFVVENRPGAGSIIGTDAVAKSTPDGYTLLVISSTHATNETLVPNKPFVLTRDFAPVATVNQADLMMVVHPSVPARNVNELITMAKKDAGKLNYASSGPGTPYHMAGELFKAMSGTSIEHVPHRAAGDARSSVVAGHVQMMFDSIVTMAPIAQAGQVRMLATTGKERSTLLPDVPTIAETALPNYEIATWVGVMAPIGTPRTVVERLNSEINRVISKPDVMAAWAKQGAMPMVMPSDQFERYLKAEIEKWADVVKRSGARVE
jgi:tripartite-type tricarboxylate transporter receptor subunit TctC